MTRRKPARASRELFTAVFTADELGQRMSARRESCVVNPWLHTTDGFHKLAAAFGMLAFIVIAVVGGFTAANGSAAVQDQINSTQSKLNSLGGHKQVLTSDLSRFSDQIGSISGQLAELRSSEARVQAQLDAEQAHLTQVQNDLTKERIRYARLKRKLERSSKMLSVRLLAIFRQDAPDMATVVLNSDGFGDLLHNVEFMNRISDADGALVREVKSLKAESKRKEESLTSLEKQVKGTVNSITAKRNEIGAKRQQVQSRVDQLNAARAARRAALASINRQSGHLEGSLASLQKDQAAASVVINQTATDGPPLSAGPVRRGGGRLIWPCNAGLFGSFGEDRGDHIHQGVDIGCPTGTPLRAAAAGTVTFAGVQGGYGNVVIISHSGGLSTLYAHQSRIAVSGGSVSQGQVIGYVGCSGSCQGPHVHFEVHEGGTAVDPMNYL